MQIPLASLFQGECFIPGLQGKTKEAVFQEMVAHLVAFKRIPADLDQVIVQSLTSRDEKLTTAIGEGIALPHASIHGLAGVVALAGKHATGLDYGATEANLFRCS